MFLFAFRSHSRSEEAASTQPPGTATGEDEQAWVAGIQAGDQDALRRLYLAYYEPLARFATSIIGDVGEASDIVQDLFAHLWEGRTSWQPRAVKPYLYQAVRNRAHKHLKKQRNRRLRHEAYEQRADFVPAAAEHHVEVAELQRLVDAAVNQLPERRREIFVLHRRHGLSYAEIAAILEIKPKTVENQMGRALQALREALGSYLG